MTQITPVDLLVVGAHPDDQELSTGGTMLKHRDLGWSIGILDLTRGELGTRGTPELRRKEALDAARFVGAEWRVGLDLTDGFLRSDEEAIKEIIRVIRAAKPKIILANAVMDRHIDHGKGSKVLEEAGFLSGLKAIKTLQDRIEQEPHRPRAIYHYIQDYHIEPDFVIDISEYMEQKIELVKCFGSQFFDPDSQEPKTPISGQEFLDFLRARAMTLGRPIGATYGEGFTVSRYLGLKDLSSLL